MYSYLVKSQTYNFLPEQGSGETTQTKWQDNSKMTLNYQFLPHFNVPQCCIITYPGIGRLSRCYKGVIFHILLRVGY